MLNQQELGLRAPEQLLTAQHLVLEMIASGSPIDDVLRAITSFIDQQEPAGKSCISLLEPDGRTLRLAVASKLPDSFTRQFEGWTIGPKKGACGTAAFRRERVIVADVATDPLYDDYRDVFLGQGLRSCWGIPIISSEGSVLGTVGVYHDRPHVPGPQEIDAVERATYLAKIAIERRRFELRLQASKDQFQAMIENTSDIIAILDVNGIIRYMSPSAERVLGFTPSELVATCWFDRLHPDDLAAARLAFERMLGRPGVAPAVERRYRHKNGSWRVIEIIGNNQFSEPAIDGIIATAHDITNRKATEAELTASQDRYRELFENAIEMVYTHDLAGKLTSLNKMAEALTGYNREEALGMNISEIIAPEYRALSREMTERKIGGETKTTYELEIISKQGVRILLEVSTRLIFHMGRPVAVQGIARDITERRQFESHLLQSQKMEAIGRLAGGVAHDFNNLLTVIAGYSQWMLDQIPQDAPLAENASEILFAANRAAALTNQLLAFSRNQVIQPIIVDLNSLVAQFDQMLRRVIGEDIDLIVKTSYDLGLIRADPGQMEQVILNLVVNARDAMPMGGRLTIETANTKIGADSVRTMPDCLPGEYVMLAVSDTGSGIDEAVKPHIFEPFFTTKEMGKGTGLGLSTVYGIVKQGGGHISVDSELGSGTMFRMYFPQVAGEFAPTVVAPRGRPPSGGTETILLVEDEIAVRRMVGGILRRFGYSILEAQDSRSAKDFVLEYGKPIHLLLTDVVMPIMGGRELAAQLKSIRRDLKVLFMSGYADECMLQEGLMEPNTAYIQKPFTPDGLAGKVRELLDGE
jgi:two-component system cell cycle sensor histidine kinase/response regulator CckA